MTRRTLIVAALLALTLAIAPGAAAAQECTFAEPADIDPLLDAYNQDVDAIPGFLRSQIAGERVEFRITGDTQIAYTIAFDENARALNAQRGSANPSLLVTADAATLCAAGTSPNPVQSLVDAYDTGQIQIEGTSPVTQVTVTAVEIGISIGRLLGLF